LPGFLPSAIKGAGSLGGDMLATRIVLMFTVTVGALLGSVPAAAAPPLAAYGQLPGISNIHISPDGTKWAAILGNESRAEIQIRELATAKLLTATPIERAKARSLQWAGPNHLLATVSTTATAVGITGPRREWAMLIDFDLTKNKWNRLLGDVTGAMNVVSGPPTPLIQNGKAVVMVPGITFPSGQGTSTLFRVPLDGGRTEVSETGNVDTNDWVIGPDGKALARADHDGKSGEWRLFLRQNGRLVRAYSEVAPLDGPFIRALGTTGETILVSTRKSGVRQVHDVTIADGAWSSPRPELATDNLIADPATYRLIGTDDTGLDSVETRFFTESDQKLWNAISRAFPGELVRLASWTADRLTAIIEVDGAVNGDAYFIVDRRKHTADWLADAYPGVSVDVIAPKTVVRYAAADGLPIAAYLTLPRDRPAKALPLIVLAHGGPAARDYPGFDWWSQALASRGYAVLQPQFRGTGDLQPALRDAGFGEWGRKMQTDLSDGVRHLAKAGTIDPARVCIVGASYGGYAALAGPTLDAGVYRCASAVAGVSDLRRMLSTKISDTGSSRNETLRYWQRFMGANAVNDPRLDAISPARLAARVSVPIQLIHGKDDTVVRFDQSAVMEKALRAAGKPVELVTLPGEDHWLSRAPTRLAMLTAMVAFLETHNPPDPATVPPPAR
jgi:dipeptidyl aminopeptidase/acylaminoacyl peptidase